MIDQTLKELWNTKDNIAKEHEYDMDKLVSYLRFKANSRNDDTIHNPKHGKAEQGTPTNTRTSHS